MSRERGIFWVLIAYALAVSGMTAFVVTSYHLPLPYLAIQPFAVAGGWCSVWAAARERWLLGSGGLAASLGSPWGYFYPGFAVGMCLVIICLVKAYRGRTHGARV